jgi:hypothetical protein
MGPYDYKKGGHLILFNIDKIIKFPPSSHILIPSAIMRHANPPIQPHKQWVGFMQYVVGGLFQWVDNGFCKSEEVGPELKAKMDAEAPTHFENLLNLYSKLDELEADHVGIFGKQ